MRNQRSNHDRCSIYVIWLLQIDESFKVFQQASNRKKPSKGKKTFFSVNEKLSFPSRFMWTNRCYSCMVHSRFGKIFSVLFTKNNLWESTSYFQQRDWLPKWNLYSNISSVKLDKSQSSRPEVFFTKGVFRNFAKFIRKQLCQSLFFNKVAGLMLAT